MLKGSPLTSPSHSDRVTNLGMYFSKNDLILLFFQQAATCNMYAVTKKFNCISETD